MHETAFAKINLALHVRRRRDDGYHDLETMFAFCEDGDRLRGEPAATLSLTVDGPFGDGLGGDGNLVMRAARALQDACGVKAGAALHLDKRLPVASGIGGGSADAAAALRLLARLWGIASDDPQLGTIAGQLGADVPACLASVAARGAERGDVLVAEADGSLSGTPLLLANPRVPLATPAVFGGWDGIDRGPLGDPLAGRNDLTAAATRLVPAIADVVARLDAQPGVTLVRMSGSGATCFALFATGADRDAAAAAMPAAWWTLATRLR